MLDGTRCGAQCLRAIRRNSALFCNSLTPRLPPQRLVESHPSVLQARAVGLFGCLDLVDGNGAELQPLSGPTNPAAATAIGALKKALLDEGVHSFVRAPYLHTAPPLIISEEELRDGFGRIDRALDAFDDALGLECRADGRDGRVGLARGRLRYVRAMAIFRGPRVGPLDGCIKGAEFLAVLLTLRPDSNGCVKRHREPAQQQDADARRAIHRAEHGADALRGRSIARSPALRLLRPRQRVC